MNIYSIYKTTNIINGKVYIGFDSNWPKRRHEHLNNSKNPQSTQVLYNAMRKYGQHNFIWEVIYQSYDQLHTLSIMENYFITEYQSYIHFTNSKGYNMTLGGEGTIGHIHTLETRNNISKALKGKTKGKSKPPRSAEYCKNMSNAKLGSIPWNKGKTGVQTVWNKGKVGVYSESQLEKMRQSAIGKSKGKQWFNDGTNDYFIFPNDIKENYMSGRIKKTRTMIVKCCPHCNASGAGGNMTRYHFDNCKNRKGT